MQNKKMKILFLMMMSFLGILDQRLYTKTLTSAQLTNALNTPYSFLADNLTKFYLWVYDSAGQGTPVMVDFDFSVAKQQPQATNTFLEVLNNHLVNNSVLLHFALKLNNAGTSYNFTVRGYHSVTGKEIKELAYTSKNNGTATQVPMGYFRYQSELNETLQTLPASYGDLTTSELVSGIWVFVQGNVNAKIATALELAQAVYQNVFPTETVPYVGLTLSKLQAAITALKSSINITTVQCQDTDFNVPGFNLSIQQVQAPLSGNQGYAFIKDPWNKTSEPYTSVGEQGVAALQKGSGAYQSIVNAMNAGASPTMTLVVLGFDKNNNFIADIIANAKELNSFVLYAFDATGNPLAGFPISFTPSSIVGVGSYTLQPAATAPAVFEFGGLGSIAKTGLTSNYPAGFQIQWVNNVKAAKNIYALSSSELPLNELWISPDYVDGSDYAEIPLISKGAPITQQGHAVSLSQVISTYNHSSQSTQMANLMLKVSLQSDTTNHYCLVKGYTNANGIYTLASKPYLYSWAKKTIGQGRRGVNITALPNIANLSADSSTKVNMTTAAADTEKTGVVSYRTNKNGICSIGFTVSSL